MTVPSSPWRVLLIDDTVPIRQLVARALNRTRRYEVVGQASNGQEGLELAAALQPALVLLDLSMPVMDGAVALPLLRELLPTATLVVLSGFERGEMREELLTSGADAVLEKGMSLKDEIVPALDAVLARRP